MPVPKRDASSGVAAGPSRRLLTDEVFDRISDEIIRGVLAPGQRIHDLDLAARLGMSRATIRTAILRLTDLGLVETVPNISTRVTPIRVERYVQTQDTARALFVFAVRYGTPVLTDELIADLRKWGQRLGNRESISAEAIFDGSAGRFFQTFQLSMDNHPLDRTMLRLRPHLQRVMGQYAHLLPAVEIDDLLEQVIEAASRRDPDAAAAAMSAYYDGPLATFQARLEARPELAIG